MLSGSVLPTRATASFPELRRDGVGVFIATPLARLVRDSLTPAFQHYETMSAAYAAVHGQMAYYRALERQGVLRWIKDAAALRPAETTGRETSRLALEIKGVVAAGVSGGRLRSRQADEGRPGACFREESGQVVPGLVGRSRLSCSTCSRTQ